MPTNYDAATNGLLFIIASIGGRVTKPVDATTNLHPKNFKFIADHPLDVCLGMDMTLDRGLHVVFSTCPGRTAFAVYILDAVINYPRTQFKSVPRTSL